MNIGIIDAGASKTKTQPSLTNLSCELHAATRIPLQQTITITSATMTLGEYNVPKARKNVDKPTEKKGYR